MSFFVSLKSLPIDRFLILLIGAVIVASFLPCYGEGKVIFSALSTFAIGLLFFMHGAKLDLSTMMDAFLHWRLHAAIFLTTFVIFPCFGILIQGLPTFILSKELATGFLFLCTLPATVQSAIALTSIAKGNVAGAICSASASTLLGVFITPLLVTLLIQNGASHSMPLLDSIETIALKLILPFFTGNIARHWIGKWIHKHKKRINQIDRISILLVVYVAFSDAVVNGIWQQTDFYSFGMIVLISLVLLSCILIFTTFLAKWLKFSQADTITLVFCGSKKSLASGIPMASILFSASNVGLIVLPLMLFHQIQLMVCSYLAARYAKSSINKTESQS